jgi:hypothetical protein
MLSLRDCIGLCDVTEDEIAAVAEHERIPMICAAELADYMVHSPNGVPLLKRMILDDIEAAEARADWAHWRKLRLTLYHFIRSHPDFRPD